MSAVEPTADAAMSDAHDATSAAGEGRSLAWVRDGGIERIGLPALTLALVVFFAVWAKTGDTFATSANFQVVAGNQSVLAVAALAALVPLVAGQFDLSVGATLGLSSTLVASLLSKHHMGIPEAVVLGMLGGMAVGLINGVLVAYVRVNSLIVTLGMATIIGGFVVEYSGGETIVNGIPSSMVDFGSGKVAGLPNALVVLAVIAILVSYLLGATPFGRYLRSIGSSPPAARLVGLSVERLVAASFVTSGLLAGAAGALQVARAGGANPNVGTNFTLPALAAAFLGATTIKPGRYNVAGTLVAIAFLAILTSGLNLSGASDFVTDYVNGGALILGVAFSTLMARRRLGA